MKNIDGQQVLISTALLVGLICLIIMTSCAPAPKKPDPISPIANARDIGRALGCVFGSKDGVCKSEEQKKAEEQEFIREFKKVDEAKTPPTSK